MKVWRKWSADDRQKVAANYGRGMTAAEIGEMLGRSTMAVWREACRQGLTNQAKEFTPKPDRWYPVAAGQLRGAL